MKKLLLGTFFTAAILGASIPDVRAATCSAEDFAKAVDEAGSRLRAFNLEASPKLQAKIKELAAREGWSDADRDAHMREVLDDDRTARLDATANQLLGKIEDLGRPDTSKPLDCASLDDLKAAGIELLATMKAKSALSLSMLDAEMAKAPRSQVGKEAQPLPRSIPRTTIAKPSPQTKSAEEKDGKAPSKPWSTTAELDPSYKTGPSIGAPAAPLWANPDKPTEGYAIEEIQDVARGFFGTLSTNLASVIEYAFATSGRPSGYVLGTEGGGAFLAGLRYGDGTLYFYRGQTQHVYWRGPSLGFAFGAEGSRTLFLIYNLERPEQLYRRFTGIDGSAYLVGGVGVTFLKGGDVIMAPIRTGLGLKIGASIGYVGFSSEPSWDPF